MRTSKLLLNWWGSDNFLHWPGVFTCLPVLLRILAPNTYSVWWVNAFSYFKLMLGPALTEYLPYTLSRQSKRGNGYSGAVLLGVFTILNRRGSPNLLFSKLNGLLNSTKRKDDTMVNHVICTLDTSISMCNRFSDPSTYRHTIYDIRATEAHWGIAVSSPWWPGDCDPSLNRCYVMWVFYRQYRSRLVPFEDHLTSTKE